jgi:uncharacterized protein YecT (DUF1311 family)
MEFRGFQMAVRKRSLQATVLLWFILLLSFPCFSEEVKKFYGYFHVQVLETSDTDLSDIILEAYERRFNSKNLNSNLSEVKMNNSTSFEFINHFNHPEIDWMKWKSVDLGIYGSLFEGNLNLGGKSMFIHKRSHSWRGDIYTGFLVPPEKKQYFIDSFKKGEFSSKDDIVFYPAWARERGDYSWGWNNVFRYKDGFYFLDDYSTFDYNDGIRHLYKVVANGQATSVAQLKVFLPIQEIDKSKQYPAYLSLWHTLHNMFGRGSLGSHAGTLRAHDRARAVGHHAAARAIIRPWIVSAHDPSYNRYSEYHVYNDKMLSFLKDWSLWELWNFREHQTLFEHVPAAEHELAKLYHTTYGMNKKAAKELARSNIQDVIAAYFIVPNSYPQYRENDLVYFREQVSTGTYSGSLTNRTHDMKLCPESYVMYQAGAEHLGTFAIDNIQYLKQILATHNYADLKNSFSKTLLMYAAHMNHFGAVKYLVEAGADVNELTGPNDKYGPFHYLPRNLKRSALTYAIENSSIEIISYLLDKGAKANLTGESLAPYLLKNPRFSKDERKLPIGELVRKYRSSGMFFKPSFDAKKAQSPIEKVICASKTLSIYDRELGRAYNQLRKISSYPEFDKQYQIAWLKRRNHECKKLKGQELIARLTHLMRSRTRYLHNRIENTNND